MKIGILTFPLNYNYGNLLQAYALIAYLKRYEKDVELIDKRKSRKSVTNKIKYLVKWCLSYCPLKFIHEKRQNIIIHKGFDLFIDEYLLPKTQTIYNKKQLVEVALKKKYNAIFVGSDQVWRVDYIKDDIYIYFLDFAPSYTNKIAYAASFGTDVWQFDEEQTKKISQLAERFNYISVREDSAIGLCRDYLNIDVLHLIDPTLLLDVKHYYSLIDEIDLMDIPPNIFQYFLEINDMKLEIVNLLNSYFHLPICEFSPNRMVFDKKRIKSCKPIHLWLKGISQSDFVVTDSFHGTVFAILFNKPFLTLGNEKRGLTRIHSLLKMFGLENRLICCPDLDIKDFAQESIPWSHINDILREKRKDAETFIMNALYGRMVN